VFRRVDKQLTCPRCGNVVADASYRPLSGTLTVTAVEGTVVLPAGAAVQLGIAERSLAGATTTADREEAQARLDFVRRNVGEVIYEMRCQRGHVTMRTAPQITRAVRRAGGRWAALG
jgi:hypothetical protein